MSEVNLRADTVVLAITSLVSAHNAVTLNGAPLDVLTVAQENLAKVIERSQQEKRLVSS